MQEQCTGSAAQEWSFVPIGGGNYNIVNDGNGLCMDAVTNTDFGVVETFPCTGISNQKWSLGQVPPVNVPSRIISRVAGGSRCLDVQEGSLAPNGLIDIFHCTSNNQSQAFTVN